MAFRRADRGNRRKTSQGYIVQLGHKYHPRADACGRVLEHILVVEKAMGKPLPVMAKVHHVNWNPMDNSNENLVVCEDDAYHQLLHSRTVSYGITGSPNNRWCNRCKQWKNISEFDHVDGPKIKKRAAYCKECRREVIRQSYYRNRDKVLARQKARRDADIETARTYEREANGRHRAKIKEQCNG